MDEGDQQDHRHDHVDREHEEDPAVAEVQGSRIEKELRRDEDRKWYRDGFGHGGQAATLEEWFDPARLEDGYVPKGFHLGPGPIEGHEKGLDLTPDEKQDLIAFLKTL